MQGLCASLAIGGATGLIINALEPQLAQAIGGVGSMANGYGAISTGISLMKLGGFSSWIGINLNWSWNNGLWYKRSCRCYDWYKLHSKVDWYD